MSYRGRVVRDIRVIRKIRVIIGRVKGGCRVIGPSGVRGAVQAIGVTRVTIAIK